MKKISISTLINVFLILSFFVVASMAQEKGQQHTNLPFLITGKMPHLTKLLMQQWDNSALHLTDEQKTSLLVIRKETISNVKKLGKEIAPLENQVVEGSRAGKKPEELQSLVQSIAKLKAEATMVHLRCLSRTSAILSKEQLEILTTQ